MAVRRGTGFNSLNKLVRRFGVTAGATALAVATFGFGAQAEEYKLFSMGPVDFSAQGTAGAGLFALSGAQFGAGVRDARGGQTDYTKSPTTLEMFVKPQLNIKYNSSIGSLYAVGNAVATQTVGTGEAGANAPVNFGLGTPSSSTAGNPGEVSLDEAYIGYSFDMPFAKEGSNIAIQLGKQAFTIDDGFVIGDGTFNEGGHRGSYYVAPRLAFNGYGVVKFNSNPIRADIFALKNTFERNLQSDNNVLDSQETTFVGIDLSYFQNADHDGADGNAAYLDRKRYVTATYLRVTDTNVTGNTAPNGVTNRKDMNVFSLAAGGPPIPTWESFTIFGNYVSEWRDAAAAVGGGNQLEIDANALYVEPGYTFDSLPWTPYAYFRYSYFSGDNNAADNKQNAYDPLFYYNSPRRFYGTGFSSEIGGQYNFFNSNLIIYQAGIAGTPGFHVLNDDDALKLGLNYFSFNSDKRAATQGDSHLADEVNFTTEYTYSAKLFTTATLGIAWPGAGTQQLATSPNRAQNETYLFELMAFYTF